MKEVIDREWVSSHTFQKKLLVCAVASVLAGWVNAEDFDPSQWPPNKTKIVYGDGEPAEIPENTFVFPNAQTDERNNIIVGNGGKIINKGTITGGQIKKRLTMIEATTGDSNKVTNKGTINSATVGSGGDDGSADVVVKIAGPNSEVINEGVINVQGTTHDNSGAVGLHITHGRGQNRENGSITYANNRKTNAVIVSNEGTFINQGTITAKGDSVVGCVLCYGCREVTNEGTIDTSGSTNAAVGIQSSENDPGKPGAVTINNNGGTIKTGGASAHGIAATGEKITYTVTHSGSIETTGTGAVGIRQHGGSLTHSGRTVSAGTAIHLSGSFSESITPPGQPDHKLQFHPGSYVESTARGEQKIAIQGGNIQGDNDGTYPIHILGGTFKGAIMGSGTNDHLFIEPPQVVPLIDNAPVNIQGDIIGFESIMISGKAWSMAGPVTGTSLLQVLDGGQVDKLRVTSSRAEPITGERVFSLVTTATGSPYSLFIDSGATVKELEISQNGILTFTSNNGTLETVRVTGDSWQVGSWLTDIKTLEADGRIDNLHIAKAKLDIPPPAILPVPAPTLLKLETATQPVTITSNAIGTSTIGNLHIHNEATLSEVSLIRTKDDDGVMHGTNIIVEGTGWQSSGTVVDPLSIEIPGTIAHLSDQERVDQEAIAPEDMRVRFTGAEGVFTVTAKGTAQTVDFSSDKARPPLRFIQEGGTTNLVKGNGKVDTENPDSNDTLDIRSGTVVESTGFVNYAITGDRTKETNLQLSDPVSIEIGKAGKVARVGLAPEISPAQAHLQTTSQIGNVNVRFPTGDAVSHRLRLRQTKEELPDAFVISNTGGEITDAVDFSNPGNTACPALVFNQAGGTTNRIVGGTGKGDQLVLSGGTINDIVNGFETVHVTGSGWQGVKVNNPVKVQIHKDVAPAQEAAHQRIANDYQGGHISLLTTLDQVATEMLTDRLQLMFTGIAPAQDNDGTAQVVDVFSSNQIDAINFADNNPQRPAIKITQDGGTIGDIAGMYKDTLHVTGSRVSGNINGLSVIRFSGTETEFAGESIKTDGTVSVGNDSGNAKLTLSKGGTVNVLPADNHPTEETVAPTRVYIEEGGTLDTVMPGSASNTCLNVQGLYQQDGTLRTMVAKQPGEEETPLAVDARAIKLGDKAIVDIPNLPAALSDSSVLLMKSGSEIDGTAPVTHQSEDIRYIRFGSMLSESRKEVRLNSMSMGKYISGLAAQGKADDGSLRAIEAAINPKGDGINQMTADDPLNDWTRAQCRAVNDDPVAVARIASQMKPDNSGASISGAKAGLHQSGRAISARQSVQRTGVSTGDMYGNNNVWIQYAYNNATQDEKDGVYGYEATTHGFTLGADADMDDINNFGAAYTYSKGDIKGSDNSQSNFDTSGHIFSLYGTLGSHNSPTFLDAQLSYGMGENDGKRQVNNAGEIKAKYDTTSWYVGLLAGYPMPMENGDWSWIPQVAFNYANIKTDDYKEEGSSPNSTLLTFDKVSTDKYEIMEIGAGLKIAGDITRGSTIFKPEASFMVYHDFKDDPVNMTAHFAAGGNSFVVHGNKRDTTRMQVGLGAKMDMGNNISLSASYDYNWMDSFSAHSVKIKGIYRF